MGALPGVQDRSWPPMVPVGVFLRIPLGRGVRDRLGSKSSCFSLVLVFGLPKAILLYMPAFLTARADGDLVIGHEMLLVALCVRGRRVGGGGYFVGIASVFAMLYFVRRFFLLSTNNLLCA